MGDSGYPLSLYVMKPFINPSTLAKGNYNKAHTATGSVIERPFGILIMKFQHACVLVWGNIGFLQGFVLFLIQRYIETHTKNPLYA